MAISTGDICTDAMNAIQIKVESGQAVLLSLENLCFVFKKKYELDGDDIRTDFQDIADWFEAQSWLADSSMRVMINWAKQSVLFTHLPDPELPSTFHSSGSGV
jgi:hypothetical protein